MRTSKMFRKIPLRLDLPFLRKLFKPGIATSKLHIPQDEILSEILGYHRDGVLPCWVTQYERPELPGADSVDWSKLYARSTERYDHLKLKWWAYSALTNSYSGIKLNNGVSLNIDMEESSFHSKLISDVSLCRKIPFPNPRFIPSAVAVECGDTEAEKLLMFAPCYSKYGMLFAVMPYFLEPSSLAVVFYLGSRLVDKICRHPHHELWCYYLNPDLGVDHGDGISVSAWGKVSYRA